MNTINPMKSLKKTVLAAAALATTAFTASAEVHYEEFSFSSLPSSVDGHPIPLRIANDMPLGFSYADCQLDGSDIAVYAGSVDAETAEPEMIPFEIDTWNPNGESLIWIRPSSPTVGAKYTLRWGGEPVVHTASDVWSGYQGVWHLSNTTPETDAYSQAMTPNSTAVGGIDGHVAKASTAGVSGRFGSSVQILKKGDSSTSGAGVWVNDAGTDSPIDGGKCFTISGWFYHDDCNYNWDHVFYKRSQSQNGGGTYRDAFAIENNSNDASFKLAARGSSNYAISRDYPKDAKKQWVYLTFVYNNASCTLYENGESLGTESITASSDNDAPLAFGNRSDISTTGVGDCGWQGRIDEVRFVRGAQNATWVAAEYKAMTGVSIAWTRCALTITPSSSGSVEGATSGQVFDFGEEVTLTAIPNDGFEFVQWEGDASSKENPLTITMDAFKTVTPVFKGVNLIQNGSFEEGIGGVNYGSYTQSNAGLVPPTGWSVSASGVYGVRGTENGNMGDGTFVKSTLPIYERSYCMVIQRGNFISTQITVPCPGTYVLTAHKVVRKGNSGANPIDVYVDGTNVARLPCEGDDKWTEKTEYIHLDAGAYTLKFQGTTSWDESQVLDDLSLCLVEEDPKYTVNFANTESQTYTATVLGNEVKDGDQVYENSIVTVTATPAEGYGYGTIPEGWTESGASITRDFTIVADTAITIPEAQPLADVKYTLTLAPCTWGSIAGKSGEFSAGETTELTAIPEDDGFYFAGWTGAAEGETANPITVTMDGNKTIGAIFKPVNLIKNGSFEDCEDDIGPGKFKDDGNFTRPTGWDGGKVLIRGKDSGAGDGTYVGDGTYITESEKLPDGQFCVGFKRAGSLSTSVTVKKSGRYTLTIQKIRRKNDTWGGSLIEVCFDDATIGTISVPSNSKWEEQSFEVRLGPGEHTLKFNNPNTYDESIFLDDISFVLQEELPAEVVVDTEHVNQTFDYQNVGVERTINVKVEVPSVGYTIKYSTTKEGEYTTEPIKYWQAGEYTIYYRVETEGMEPAAGFGTVTIGENWMPNGSFEIGTWISAHEGNYGYLNSVQAATEGWTTIAGLDNSNAHIAKKGAQAWFKSGVNPADGDYAHVVYRQGKISAPMNLARSGKYQFSCKYLCRTFTYDGEGGQQKAIVKIDDQEIATIENVKNPNSWTDFSTEKFQLKKGEHEITIEGTTSQNSTILLDALRLDFKGGNGLLIMLN